MILHADLVVTSMDSALEFYCTKLGFSIIDDTTIHGTLPGYLSDGAYNAVRLVLIRVSRVGAMIELQEFKNDSLVSVQTIVRPLNSGQISILVSDLQGHISNAKENGLYPESDLFSVVLPRQGPCNIVFYRDPDGNRIEFVQVTQSSLRQS